VRDEVWGCGAKKALCVLLIEAVSACTVQVRCVHDVCSHPSPSVDFG
jgi:hypothetical protein